MASLIDEDDLLPRQARMEDLPSSDFSDGNLPINNHFLGGNAAGIWSYGSGGSSLPVQNGLDFQDQHFIPNEGLFADGSAIDWNAVADNMWAYNEMDNGMGNEPTMLAGNTSNPMDVISQEGMYAYAEALSRYLNNSGSSLAEDVEADSSAVPKTDDLGHPLYDPFRSVPFSNDSFDHLVSPSTPLENLQEEALSTDEPVEIQPEDTRPTFADMAKKAKRTSSGNLTSETNSMSKDGSVYESQESLSSAGKGRSNSASRITVAKTFRTAHARHAAARYMPLPITTDSKYGLDDFTLPCEDEIDTEAKKADLDPPTATPTAKAETWFDPRRMFSNPSRSRSESEPAKPSSSPIPTVLNNKSRVVNAPKSSSRRGHADYINNLHSTAETPSSANVPPKTKQTNADREVKPSSDPNGRAMNGKAMNGHVNGVTTNGKSHLTSTRNGNRSMETVGRNQLENEDPSKDENNGIAEKALLVLSTGKWVALKLMENLLICLLLFGSFALQLAGAILTQSYIILIQAFRYLAVKVGYATAEASPESDFLSDYPLPNIGLETNIKLPESADEAVKRLLSCGDSDAYTILGLRSDCCDEDIRRYYRRQAVFVHPDKNQQKGAEEAFKTLVHAFDFIGEPTKRAEYDKKLREEMLSEGFRREFTDLLGQFKEKLEEQRKWVHCNVCNEKHRRYITSRPLHEARKCSRCSTLHAAKEGDIWAETSYMGFKWHFYGCMDNTIYEITPWVQCQSALVDKFIPNSHLVQFKLSLGENSSQQNHARQSRAPPRCPNFPEADTLFQKYFNNSTSNMSSEGRTVPPSAKRNKRRGKKR